jgi:hypothetical protein
MEWEATTTTMIIKSNNRMPHLSLLKLLRRKLARKLRKWVV